MIPTYNFPSQSILTLDLMCRIIRRCLTLFTQVYFTPKSSTNYLKLIGHNFSWHSSNVTNMCAYQKIYSTPNNLLCGIIYTCVSKYVHFLTSVYTYPLCMYWYKIYRMRNSSGIFLFKTDIFVLAHGVCAKIRIFYIHAYILWYFVWYDAIPVLFYCFDVYDWGDDVTWVF